MNKLQSALKVNAIFSGTTGIALTILNRQVAKIFGIENNTVFLIIGLALVFFAVTIIIEIVKQRSLAILWIIIQDFIWVVGSIILLVFDVFTITATGKMLIGIVASIVLFMGLNQAKALTQIDKNLKKKKNNSDLKES